LRRPSRPCSGMLPQMSCPRASPHELPRSLALVPLEVICTEPTRLGCPSVAGAVIAQLLDAIDHESKRPEKTMTAGIGGGHAWPTALRLEAPRFSIAMSWEFRSMSAPHPHDHTHADYPLRISVGLNILFGGGGSDLWDFGQLGGPTVAGQAPWRRYGAFCPAWGWRWSIKSTGPSVGITIKAPVRVSPDCAR
jgi:hypothetical protein